MGSVPLPSWVRSWSSRQASLIMKAVLTIPNLVFGQPQAVLSCFPAPHEVLPALSAPFPGSHMLTHLPPQNQPRWAGFQT